MEAIDCDALADEFECRIRAADLGPAMAVDLVYIWVDLDGVESEDWQPLRPAPPGFGGLQGEADDLAAGARADDFVGMMRVRLVMLGRDLQSRNGMRLFRLKGVRLEIGGM